MTQRERVLEGCVLAEMGMSQYTGRRSAPTHEEIAALAFCFYEARGREEGYHLEDWLQAERELIHHYA